MIKKVNYLAFLAAAILLNGCLAGKYMCNFALLPEEHGNDIEGDRAKTESRYPGILSWYDTLHENGAFRDTSLIGENGYKLHGVYASAADPSKAQGTAIVVHGYTDNHICFLNLVRMYRDDLNYNVMVPDLHYHGLSEGRAVQMGWFDRLDVKRFAAMAHDIWGDDFMVVHGVSMGGATTMMLSGDDDLPEYIRAFVDDCGYSSVWDQFAHNLKEMFHLPPFPVLTSANIVCRKRYGWDFKEASSVNQLAKCERPVLFIHGKEDKFVPTWMSRKNYEACPGKKQILLVDNAGHGSSVFENQPLYEQTEKAFLADALGE